MLFSAFTDSKDNRCVKIQVGQKRSKFQPIAFNINLNYNKF